MKPEDKESIRLRERDGEKNVDIELGQKDQGFEFRSLEPDGQDDLTFVATLITSPNLAKTERKVTLYEKQYLVSPMKNSQQKDKM